MSRIVLFALLMPVFIFPSYGASIAESEFEYLVQAVRKSGAVRVQVNFAAKKSRILQSQASTGPISSATSEDERLLKAELGNELFSDGAWKNGTGQLGLSITEQGLRIVKNSQNALSFSRDLIDVSRHSPLNWDGSLTLLQSQISSNGSVFAEIVMGVESAEYDLKSDGSTVIRKTAEVELEASRIIQRMREIGGTSAEFVATLKQNTTAPELAIAKIDKQTFLILQDIGYIRALRPTGFKDDRTTTWATFNVNNKGPDGRLEFAIVLKGGSLYSLKPLFGSKAGLHQAEAQRRAIKEILSAAGIDSPPPDPVGDFQGIFTVALTSDQLEKLKDNADNRVLDVSANQPMYSTQLNNSAPLMNLPAAWSAGTPGYKGAGETIVA